MSGSIMGNMKEGHTQLKETGGILKLLLVTKASESKRL